MQLRAAPADLALQNVTVPLIADFRAGSTCPGSRSYASRVSDNLLKIVNGAGFAFQLAVERAIKNSHSQHGWDVLTTEHGWRDQTSPRFVDIVLSKLQRYLVVECKRSRRADWVFLVPDGLDGKPAEKRRHFRTHYSRNEKDDGGSGNAHVAGLANFQLDPKSWESSFCTILNGDDDRPMLDRLGAEVTRSADAIAGQLLEIDKLPAAKGYTPATRAPHTVVPVIVTNARLHVCVFDPGAVPLRDGQLTADGGRFEQVQHVRYRKQLDAVIPQADAAIEDLRDWGALAQRSLAIVQAEYLPTWLGDFKMDRASYGG